MVLFAYSFGVLIAALMSLFVTHTYAYVYTHTHTHTHTHTQSLQLTLALSALWEKTKLTHTILIFFPSVYVTLHL